MLVGTATKPELASLGFLRTSSTPELVTASEILNATGWPFNVQVIDGTGAPDELHEMVTELPSITVTIDVLSAVVLATTIEILKYS